MKWILSLLISILASVPAYSLSLTQAPLILPPYPRLPQTSTYQLPAYPTLPPIFRSNYQPYQSYMANTRPRSNGLGMVGSLLSGLLNTFMGGMGYGYNPYGMNYGYGGNAYGWDPYANYAPAYTPSYSSSYTPSYTSNIPYSGPTNYSSAPITAPPISTAAPQAPLTAPPIATAPQAPVSLPPDMASTGGHSSAPPTAPASPRSRAIVTAPDVITPGEQRQIRARNNAERAAQNSQAWPRFYQLFKQCAPNCEPYAYDAYAHNRYSCHNMGRAIDVHGMTCGGQVFMAQNEMRAPYGPFNKMVTCVQQLGQSPANRMIVLWHQNQGRGVTRDHWDHGHFSMGCYNGSYW